MKNIAFAASIAMLITGPALAEGGTAGHFEFGLGVVSPSDGDDFKAFSGAARFNVAFGNGGNIQAEIGKTAAFNDNFDTSTVTPGAHLWYGNDNHAFGVFTAISFGEAIALHGGIEAEKYFGGNAAIGGQLALTEFSDLEEFTTVTGRAWAKYYFTPNTKLTGEVFLVSTEIESDDLIGVSGAIEHRHADKPISGFASVQYSTIYDYSDVTALLGFRLFSDSAGTTLYQHDMMVPWTLPAYNIRIVR